MSKERLEVLIEEAEVISGRLAEQFRNYHDRLNDLVDVVDELRCQLDYCIGENNKLKDCLMQHEYHEKEGEK